MEDRTNPGEGRDVVEELTDKVQGLEQALLSRDVIGQAKGILMERLHITPDQAFEQLRSASQRMNRKVKEIAVELAETGEWPVNLRSNGHGSNGHSPDGQSPDGDRTP